MIRGVSWFAVLLDHEREDQRELLQNTVQNRSAGQWVEVEREYANLMGILGQGENVTWGLTLISFFLSCSVVALLLVERFEAMSRDLGLYRALGYSRTQISAALLWEAFILGVLGICLGMVLERGASVCVPWIWNPAWLQSPAWPSMSLLLLWGSALTAVLLIPVVPIIRLYRWAAHESLSAF
jgi:ABC-type antimicrobial peptide transport system permease subunit